MRGWLWVIACLGVVATGCATTPDESGVNTDRAAAQGAVAASSPLVEVIGFSSDTELNRQQFASLQQQSDDQVSACMAAQGWQWKPNPQPPGSALAAGNRHSLAWARAHGLGVTDQLSSLDQPGLADPNGAYLADFDPQDLLRWQTALWGDTSALEPDQDQSVVYAPAGCLGEAFASSRPRFELYQQFEQELETLARRIAADPRIVAHQTTWRSCMETVGYPYEDVTQIRGSIFERMLDVPGVAAVMASSESGGADDQLASRFDQIDRIEFDELAALEREIAVANVTCSQGQLQEAEQIRDTYEERFVVDHRTRLDAAVATTLASS